MMKTNREKEFFVKECMDCPPGKNCFGYKFDNEDYTCEECDPNCIIIYDKNCKRTTGLCQEHFEKRLEDFHKSQKQLSFKF